MNLVKQRGLVLDFKLNTTGNLKLKNKSLDCECRLIFG